MMTSYLSRLQRTIGAAFCLALAAASAGCREAAVAGPPPEAPVYSQHRVSFPAAHLPKLQLPSGGEREIGSLLNVAETMDYGDFVWNDEGVPDGKVWVLVDLKAQTMSVFKGKHEIATAVTLYGVDEKPTPIGRFPVIEKRKDHWSNLYDAPMPYTLRLTYDGVAIHGSDVRKGAGTHGCLGVPLEFGKRLFAEVKVGDEVVIVEDAKSLAPSAAEIG
ncbi:MAG TPA: L,D-transpeptidase family protein [Sphingomicrobium sp.]|nr:L,D-transpeptidase family protein [Sphingomicrobium sp.]